MHSLFRSCVISPVFLLFAVFSLASLTACTTETEVSSRFSMAPAVLSVSEPNTIIPAQSVFAWLPQSQEYHADPRFRGAKINHMVEDAIRQSLQQRRYVFQSNASGANYLIAYVAGLENDLDDREMMKRFGIVPGVAANSTDAQAEKGTLVIYVIDTRTGRRIWRSALQTLVTLDMDDAVRQQRIYAAVDAMFATLPGAR